MTEDQILTELKRITYDCEHGLLEADDAAKTLVSFAGSDAVARIHEGSYPRIEDWISGAGDTGGEAWDIIELAAEQVGL